MNTPIIKHPDTRLEDPCLNFWLRRKGWYISPPFAQWDYWHIIKNDGGVIPLIVDTLIFLYENDPLYKDKTA